MKPRESMVRLKLFKVREKRRQIDQLELMISEFDRMSAELANQIKAEEQKSGVSDAKHFAYSTFARAARQRRANLLNSISELKAQKLSAEQSLVEMQNELERALALEERDGQVVLPNDVVFVQRRSMIG